MKQKAVCWRGMLIESAVEPTKCFVFFAERRIHSRNGISRDILLARFLYQLIENTARVFAPPHSCISNRQPGAREMCCRLRFFIKRDCLLEVTFFAIGISERGIKVNIIRI